MLKMTVDVGPLRDRLNRMRTVSRQRMMSGVGFIMEGGIKKEIHLQNVTGKTKIRTGAFLSSIFSWANQSSAYVASGVKYAIYLEYGTRPHIIKAVNKKVLANRRTGQVFGSVVHHPGTAARHVFLEGLRKSKGDVCHFIMDTLLAKKRVRNEYAA